jgi:hypothetical protein
MDQELPLTTDARRKKTTGCASRNGDKRDPGLHTETMQPLQRLCDDVFATNHRGFSFSRRNSVHGSEHSSLNYPDKMDGSGNLFAPGLLQEILWKDM